MMISDQNVEESDIRPCRYGRATDDSSNADGDIIKATEILKVILPFVHLLIQNILYRSEDLYKI